MYYAYILINFDHTKTYTGWTSDIQRRLSEHNSGKNKSSKAYGPYSLVHFEEFQSIKEAMAREKFYKTTSGRRKIKQIIAQSNRGFASTVNFA